MFTYALACILTEFLEWDAVVSNHESAHRRHRVPMHPQQNTKEGTLIAPNGDVSAGRLRRRTKKRKGNKKSKKKRKLCKSRGTTSVGAAQTIVNSHEPETASTSASTQFGCDSDSIPTNITTTSSSTIPSTKATTTTPTVAAAQPTVSGCALGDKAHPPMQRPLAVDWSVAARRCHMGWRGPRSDSGAAVGGGGDEGMCGDEALVARLAGLLASEHAAGELTIFRTRFCGRMRIMCVCACMSVCTVHLEASMFALYLDVHTCCSQGACPRCCLVPRLVGWCGCAFFLTVW